MNPELIPILIFLLPFFGTLLLPLFMTHRTAAQIFTASILGGAALVSLLGLLSVNDGSFIVYLMGGWPPPFGIEWRLDSFNAVMTLLVSVTAFTVIAGSGPAERKDIKTNHTAYYMTALLHVSALMGMLLTNDLFNLFVFIEVSSLTAYALIATGDDRRGNVASLRYLFVGTVGACFYLLGVGYFYAATGTLNMTDLAARLPEVLSSKTIFMGVLFMAIGLFIKMGLFPFHGWLPDAYAYASDSATALIAPLMTKTAIYAIIRIFILVLGIPVIHQFGIPAVMIWLGAAAIVAGSVMAFAQSDFKRMLAYSSISHIGLIVLGLGLNHPSAFVGAILHIVNHAVMKAALFLIAASAFHRHGVRDIYDFAKLRGRMPLTLAAFTVAALSMIGVPPLCGFFSKWYILIGAVQSGYPLMAGVIVFSSLLTALYFFKVMEQAFFQKQKEAVPVQEGALSFVFSISGLAACLIGLGLYAPRIYFWGLRVFVSGGGG